MLFAIMMALFSSVVFATPRDVSASKESRMDIPDFEDIHGKFRSVDTVFLNWAGNICPKTTAFMALYSKRCVKTSQGKTTGQRLDA